MLKYRAAVFLIRSHFPEVLFGMQTVEEITDVVEAQKVEPVKVEQAVIEAPKEDSVFLGKRAYLSKLLSEIMVNDESGLMTPEEADIFIERIKYSTTCDELNCIYADLKQKGSK